MKLHDTPPFAPVLMESTRAMGYSLESAIADIIDNSIAAQASSVLVKFSPYDTMQYVSILDDGTGMNRQACVIIIAIATVVCNLLVDLCYGLVDPHVRLERR